MALERISFEKKFPKYKTMKSGDLVGKGVLVYDGQSSKYGNREYHLLDREGGNLYVLSAVHNLSEWFDTYLSLGDYVVVTYSEGFVMTEGRGKGKTYHRFNIDVDREKFESVKGAATPNTDKSRKEHSTSEAPQSCDNDNNLDDEVL